MVQNHGIHPSPQRNSLLWKDPPFLMGKSTISMSMFNSYVSLPEGTHRGFFHILACLPYDPAEIGMFFWRNLWDEFGFVAKYVGTQGDMMGPHISIYNIIILYIYT